MAVLIVYSDQGERTVPLKEGASSVGRLPESDVSLPESTVSGRHAQILFRDGQYLLEDIGSRNGTFLNAEPISDSTPLNHGDEIHFGHQLVIFQAGAPEVNVRQTSPIPQTLNIPSTGAAFLSGAEDASFIKSEVAAEGRYGVLHMQPEAKLKALLEISAALAGAIELDVLLHKILDALFDIFKHADRGCIVVRSEETGMLIPRAFKHRRESNDETVRLSQTVVNKVMADKAGVLSADASSDEQFDGAQSINDLRIRSMMCVPMIGLDGEPSGVISIDSQNPIGQFDEDDLDLLMAVAGQASLAYESTRLMSSYLRKQKQDNELAIASEIQLDLLPSEMPAYEGWEFFASYDAAQAVGGDYYDCIALPDGKICLSFGDVAGKGVPGAMIMSRMSSCVQSTMKHVHEAAEAVHAINDHMCDSRVSGRFVTYIMAIVDPATGRVDMVNAGHTPPMIRRASGVIDRADDDDLVGPPIGVMEGYPYEAETLQLNEGDVLVITTDGVDEAMSPSGEFYETERVIEFLKSHDESPAELGRMLLDDVRRHADGREQNDDITIMTCGRR